MTRVESCGEDIVIVGDLAMKTQISGMRQEFETSGEKLLCRLTFDDGTILQGCWTACENWLFRLLRKGEKVVQMDAGPHGFASSVVFTDGLRWGFLSTKYWHFDQEEKLN